MKEKISVIVPVYNVESYLARCIESIANQTYGNLEIILINDGSKDNSRAICETYAKNDARIVVIDQNNSGSSIARNTGLDKATGTIIAFVDSDDYIENTMFDKMVQAMAEHQLDVIEIEPKDPTKIKTFSDELTIEDRQTATKRIIKNTSFSVWRRLYKKSVIEDMRFIPKIIHQDVFFTIDFLKRITSIGYLNSPLYIYNTESIGIIRSKYTLEKIQIGIRATEYIVTNTTDDKALKKVIDDYVVFYYTDHYFLLSRNKTVDPDRALRKKLKNKIQKALNKKNIGFRSLLVILLPHRIMELISSLKN